MSKILVINNNINKLYNKYYATEPLAIKVVHMQNKLFWKLYVTRNKNNVFICSFVFINNTYSYIIEKEE